LVKPVDTPVTRDCRSDRVVPHMARAVLDSSTGRIESLPSSREVVTLSETRCDISPSLPLAVKIAPSIDTWTSPGISMGFLPTRDMRLLLEYPP
jgi:hypothetical protein